MFSRLISEDFGPIPKWLQHGQTISTGLAYSLLHESSLTHAVANTRIVISSRQLYLAHCVRVSQSSFLIFSTSTLLNSVRFVFISTNIWRLYYLCLWPNYFTNKNNPTHDSKKWHKAYFVFHISLLTVLLLYLVSIVHYIMFLITIKLSVFAI